MTCAMRVVSNTSPLLNMAIVGHLALVRQQFGQVWIPPAVLVELQPDTERPGSSPPGQPIRSRQARSLSVWGGSTPARQPCLTMIRR